MVEGIILFERTLLQVAFLIGIFFWGPKYIKKFAEAKLGKEFGDFFGFIILLVILSVAHIFLADFIMESSTGFGWVIIVVLFFLGYLKFSSGNY